MPLILEGSDHLGKTTLARQLVNSAEAIGIPAYYAHMTRPPRSWDFYTHYIQRMQPFAVQDRFLLGAMVYHPGAINNFALRMLNAHLTLQGSLTVLLCNSDTARYRQHLTDSPKEEMFDVEQMLDYNRQWCGFAEDPSFYGVDAVIDTAGGFPTEAHANDLVRSWKQRLDEVIGHGELRHPSARYVPLWKFGR